MDIKRKGEIILSKKRVQRVSSTNERIHFQVDGTETHMVVLDLVKRQWSCDCKYWSLHAKPCSHIYAAYLLLDSEFLPKRRELVERMKAEGAIKTKRVENAFLNTPRHMFVASEYFNNAYVDRPLPIGKNQTISQPSIVADMLELLELNEGSKILEIGAGSGYVVSLLSKMGFNVIGYEIDKKIAECGQKNIKISFSDGKIVHGNGLKAKGIYDGILLSAAAPELPDELFDKLSDRGIIVAPVGKIWQKLVRCKKDKSCEEFEFCSFVPLKLE